MPLLGGGEADLVCSAPGGVGCAPAWSPDGARLTYTAPASLNVDKATDEQIVRVARRLDYKSDGRGFVGARRLHVFVADVASGAQRRISGEDWDHYDPQWSPDGRLIAAKIERLGLGDKLALLDVEAGGIRLLGPEDSTILWWGWAPTGERLIFTADIGQSGQPELYLYDHQTNDLQQLTADLPWLPLAHPVWIDENRILFHGLRAGSSGLYSVAVPGGAWELLHDWQALHSGLSMDAARRHVVQAHASPTRVGELAVFDLTTGVGSVITQHNTTQLVETPPAGRERFAVTRGCFEVDAWLLLPPEVDSNLRYPLILTVHGGPRHYYGLGFFPQHGWQQVLATHGFLVIAPNSRGSTSYGRHFSCQVSGDWGGEDFNDIMAVVDRVIEHPLADPERVGILGYSYGGFMTVWALGQTTRFKAAACGAPVFDFLSFCGTSDLGPPWGAEEVGGTPHENRVGYVAHSPSTYAHRVQAPTLVFGGESDERCPITQAEQLYTALLSAACVAELARYPGAAHPFPSHGRPRQRVDIYARILAWFKLHLGDPN